MNRLAIGLRTFLTGLTLLALGAGVGADDQKTTRSEDQKRKETKQDEQQGRRGAKREQTTVFGVHTLSSGQTMRLSVLNASLASPPEPITPGAQDPPDPVRQRRVTLAFDVYALDPPEPGREHAGDGSVRTLQLVRRESRTFALQPGQAASFEIAGAPGEVIGAWTLGDPPEPVADPPEPGHGSVARTGDGANEPPDPIRAALVTSLEVRQGGTTQLVLPGVTRGFNPQPDPPRSVSREQ